jgi:tRNA (cmo5U34)-methyltransferase
VKETAAEFFGDMSESYDSLIGRAVPGYSEIIDTLLGYLPVKAETILELGCGTGGLSLRLAERFPEAAFTFVDAAEDMVELTRRRLAVVAPEAVERSRFIVSRFEELETADGEFDLVTSSFSLHHVRDKGSLLARVRRAMRSGGRLRFADQLRGAAADTQQVDWDSWVAFCRLPGHCTEEELQSLVDHSREHDHYERLDQLFAWMESAGFAEVDCLWRKGMWGIVSGTAA